MLCVYVYIYIYIEREREIGPTCAPSATARSAASCSSSRSAEYILNNMYNDRHYIGSMYNDSTY